MAEVITRPSTGTKSAARKAAAPPKSALASTCIEGDALVLKVAEVLRAMVCSVIYDADDEARNLPRICRHIGSAEHLLERLLEPAITDNLPNDPEVGDTLIHLKRISHELDRTCSLVEVEGFQEETIPVQVMLAATLGHAATLASRLLHAYEALPGSLEELRALTTFAGAKPHRDRPTPPIRRIGNRSSTNQGQPYQLAKALTEKTTRLFLVLETAEQSLKAESPNSAALPLLSTVLEQFRDCDEESDLLQALLNADTSAPVTETTLPSYTRDQLILVLEQIASTADIQNRTLMAAQQCDADEWQLLSTLAHAAQVHAECIGAMADEAAGGVIVGDFQRWFYSPNFGKKGKAA